MKPCTYLLQPDGQRVLRMETRIPSVEVLHALLNANHRIALECVPLSSDGDVLIRHVAPEASLNEPNIYTVGGHRVLGRSLVGVRSKDAGPLPNFIVGDPQIGPATLTADDVSAMLEWSAPVAGEVAERVLDVPMLDAYSKFFCEVAGAASNGLIVRVCGIDQGGHPAAAFNVTAGDWRLFRRAALDLYDRRWSVVHDWVIRDAPQVRGANDETAPVVELAEIKTKAGGHVFECYGADAKEAFGAIHAEPICGAKLAKRTHRTVAVPGLPLFVGDSGVPILPDWRLV